MLWTYHITCRDKLSAVIARLIVKLSYSCMPNLKSLINSHNQNVLKDQPQSSPETCNCLEKEDCPMNGLCLKESLLYYTTITCHKGNYAKLYKGICETTFKKRYVNHKFFSNKNDTKLSTEYWALKKQQLNPKV